MADASIRRENLNVLYVRLGWGCRRAKQLGSPLERINWIGRSSSFWSGIDPFGDADLWDIGVGFTAIAASSCRRPYGRRPASSGHWTPSQHLQCLTVRRRLLLPSTLAGHAPEVAVKDR